MNNTENNMEMDANEANTTDKIPNTEEVDLEKAMEMLHENVQAKSPVRKINFTYDTPGAFVASYLICLPNPGEILDDLADKEGLNDETWLYFEPRHIMEVNQIFYICLKLLEEQKFVKKYIPEDFVKEVFKSIHIMQYKEFKPTLGSILSKFYISANKESDPRIARAIKNFSEIFINIWFVPYAQLDKIAEIAQDEYKKKVQGDNNG